MSNIKSEQIKSDLSLKIDYDQVLSISDIINHLINILGEKKCFIKKIGTKKVFCYMHDNKYEILLLASITYLGGNGQHPIYKKRMQLKKWYKEIIDYYKDNKLYNVRFIGVYHYEDNIVFAEFVKDSYLKKKLNSSAAHIYTNDLFQAMKNNFFERIDQKKNMIRAIKDIKFKDYLDDRLENIDKGLFNILSTFNKNFCFGKWLTAKQTIPEMHDGGWNKWKETEWPGWFLEFKMNEFITENNLEKKMLYIGSSNKKANDLDFDLWFGDDKFYGDLKSSDAIKNEAPGNDQKNFIECINKYNKFWYIIYEHNTNKDSPVDNYSATRFRTNYIKSINEWPKNKPWDELSYHKRMKKSVKFVKMYVIELNKINYRSVLSDFNQGKQQDGSKRKPKFKISKKNIDNFIVFQQEFIEEKNP